MTSEIKHILNHLYFYPYIITRIVISSYDGLRIDHCGSASSAINTLQLLIVCDYFGASHVFVTIGLSILFAHYARLTSWYWLLHPLHDLLAKLV